MKIIFVCYGNICRSPMAEYLFKDILKKRGAKNIEVLSRATSREELGAPVHYGTRAVLDRLKIDYRGHRASQITKAECDSADLLIVMDSYNVISMKRICGQENESKVCRMLDFSSNPRDIDDPWYTHDFETCYNDMKEGLEGLIKVLEKDGVL